MLWSYQLPYTKIFRKILSKEGVVVFVDLFTRQLLDYLSEDKAITAAQLAARRRVGYSLEIVDHDAFDAWQNNGDTGENVIPGTSAERVQFILLYLLGHDDYVKLDELSWKKSEL